MPVLSILLIQQHLQLLCLDVIKTFLHIKLHLRFILTKKKISPSSISTDHMQSSVSPYWHLINTTPPRRHFPSRDDDAYYVIDLGHMTTTTTQLYKRPSVAASCPIVLRHASCAALWVGQRAFASQERSGLRLYRSVCVCLCLCLSVFVSVSALAASSQQRPKPERRSAPRLSVACSGFSRAASGQAKDKEPLKKAKTPQGRFDSPEAPKDVLESEYDSSKSPFLSHRLCKYRLVSPWTS